MKKAKASALRGICFRQDDGGWSWRAIATHAGHTKHRYFYDVAYGGEAAALNEALKWHAEALRILKKYEHSKTAVKNALEELGAEYDRRRPQRLYISIYLAALNGEFCQIRSLVSLRGHKAYRKEISANFRKSPMQDAFKNITARIRKEIKSLLGKEAESKFWLRYESAFQLKNLKHDEGIRLTIMIDALE